MKRPHNNKVGNREYKIIIDLTLQLKEGLVGQCNNETLTISLVPRFYPYQLDEALIHETIHQVNHIYLNNRLREDDIDALGQGLAQALQSMGVEFEWEKEAIVKR